MCVEQECEGDRAISALSEGCQQAGGEGEAAGRPDIRYRPAGPHPLQDPQLPSLFTKTVVGGAIVVLDPETEQSHPLPVIHFEK